MTKRVDKMVDDSFDALELGLDLIIPRGTDADPLFRPVDLMSKTVAFERKPAPIVTGYQRRIKGDQQVFEAMHSHPDLSKMISSFVLIKMTVAGPDSDQVYACSGCLMFPNTVFTVEHLFDGVDVQNIICIEVFCSMEDFQQNINGNPAVIKEIPPHVRSMFDPTLNLGSDWEDAQRNWLDFSLLHLEVPFAISQESLLEIASPWPADRSLYEDGQVICMMGKPGNVFEDPAAVFSWSFRQYVNADCDNPEEAFKEKLDDSTFGDSAVLASFGCILEQYEDGGEYYGCSSCSTLNGMSGGPVVNLADPAKLMGLS